MVVVVVVVVVRGQLSHRPLSMMVAYVIHFRLGLVYACFGPGYVMLISQSNIPTYLPTWAYRTGYTEHYVHTIFLLLGQLMI